MPLEATVGPEQGLGDSPRELEIRYFATCYTVPRGHTEVARPWSSRIAELLEFEPSIDGRRWRHVSAIPVERIEGLDVAGNVVVLVRAAFQPVHGPQVPVSSTSSLIVGQLVASERPGDDGTLLEDADDFSDGVAQPRGPYERRDPR